MSTLDEGRLAYFVEEVTHSWICPNGAAARGPVTADALQSLLEGGDVSWWDLHLYRQGRRVFMATDGGDEHFALLTAADLRVLAARGFGPDAFRKFDVPAS